MRRIVLLAGPWILTVSVTCAAWGQAMEKGLPPARARGNAPGARQPEAMQIPAPDPPPAVDPKVAKQRMDQLLNQWEQNSAGVRTLDAQFIREDFDASMLAREQFIGRAILKSPNLAFLDFKRVDGQKLVPYEQIRCTGNEVYHFVNSTNQIYIYPLAPQEKQRALEEGPLPFMFNMRAEEAKKRYVMTLINETLDYYVIRIQPKEEIDREAFLQADVVLDKKRFLPNALQLTGINGKDKKTFWFTGKGNYIKPNVAVNNANFQGRVLKGWSIVRPGPDGKMAGPANGPAGAAGPAAGQPVPRQSQSKSRFFDRAR